MRIGARKKHIFRRLVLSVVGISVIGVGVFFGVQYFTKTGLFKVYGSVEYDEELTADELEILRDIFTDEMKLESNLKVSVSQSLEVPELSQGEYTYNIYVPVTDFYSSETNLDVSRAEELFTNCMDCGYKMIDVNELGFSDKLLSIDGHYYLDEFNSGAVFRIIKFESESFEEEIKPLVESKFAKSFPSKESVLTFAQTGVTALSRGMNTKMRAVGNGAYFAEKIGGFLSAFDLTHTSNESSFTDFASSSNICSDKRFIDTLTAIGLDIVELGGNHNIDCGDQSAIDSVAMYKERGIKMVGGGVSADEAKVPLEIKEKGSNITLLAYNQSTGGATYDNTPGANQYYESVVASDIQTAKARGDFVIVDIQFYECNSYASTYEDPVCDYPQNVPGDEVSFFRHIIDLGADVVVGVSAHQPQTYELYGNGVIYYGLGNLFFDQVWWPGTTRSLILGHYFYNGKLLQTRVSPTVYDEALQVRLMDEETKKWYLERLANARP